MSHSRLFHTVLHCGQLTTMFQFVENFLLSYIAGHSPYVVLHCDYLCCPLFIGPMSKGPIVHRSCVQSSYVQWTLSMGTTAMGPTAMGPIAKSPMAKGPICLIVPHCRQCPTKPYNYLWSSLLSPPQPIPVDWGGSHSLPKAAFGYFWNFLDFLPLNITWREMFKIPQKCLTRIIQHVTRFSWLWSSIYSETVLAFLRLAGLQMVLYKANLSAQKKQ